MCTLYYIKVELATVCFKLIYSFIKSKSHANYLITSNGNNIIKYFDKIVIKQIASLRIHVEGVIRRLRELNMLRPQTCVWP